jgi:1,4-alpha-glucan branching enzyme
MKIEKGFGIVLALVCFLDVSGQLITADPAFPAQTDSVIITYNAAEGNLALLGYTGDVYAHTGVITSESSDGSDWKHAPGWGDNSPKYKLERIAADLYRLRIVPTIDDYYGTLPGEKVSELAFVFRSADNSKVGRTASGGDIFYPVYVKGLNVEIIKPDQPMLIVELGDSIFFEAQAQQSDSLILIHDNEIIKKTTEPSIADTLIVDREGKRWIKVIAKNDTGEVADSLYYLTRKEVPVVALPDGVEDGINYLNDTTAVLVLYAPGKAFVHVIGSFNDWEISDKYYMNITPDGERFWITLDSLEAGKEYIFQYLVEGNLTISDPYSEKVCDPQDQYISENTYPGLLPYPEGKTTGIATYLQTAQASYEWSDTDFTPPPVDELIVYELLIRDFIDRHDYRTLTDTIQYFKDLGINAIELMPVNEFEGNSSWGYNPSHYFALDKYYGPKRDLQRFIDTCHSNGIAVILDIVLNHSFGQSPLVRLYWDSQNNRPAADNPWFNQVPKHEFNVGYDINHESEATKYLVSRVLKYWLEEYRVDGYRFDLSKGLTQKNTLGDAGAMARYDASRVAILEAYADTIWRVNQETYVILEHFADNDEEQVLTDYGMMVWGNSQYNYGRAGMGWSYDGKSDFSWGCYKTRGFSKPHLVTYMESHDEQRQMFDIVTWGNYENPNYNVRNNLEIALIRGELCAAFFFTIPGPKMIWQFGEQGYDYDINYNNDRLGPKPIRWDYLEDPNRQRLFQVYAALADLKQSQPVFNTPDFTIDVADTLKTIHLRHETMDVTILGNFDTYPWSIDPSFTRTGTWYDLLSGDSLVVSDLHMPIELDKSEYRIYTSVKLETPDLISAPRALDLSISGNPEIGEEVTGHYTYFDQNSDPEGESKYRWFRGKYPNGADKVQILGALGTSYTIKEADWNHYIFFEVTPVAATGNLLTGIKEYGILDLATSVDQPIESGSGVSVYPNPSSEGFHVEIEKASGNHYVLELYNMSGSMVYRSEPATVKGAAIECYINASGMDRGIYLLKIRSDDQQIIRRIIKL